MYYVIYGEDYCDMDDYEICQFDFKSDAEEYQDKLEKIGYCSSIKTLTKPIKVNKYYKLSYSLVTGNHKVTEVYGEVLPQDSAIPIENMQGYYSLLGFDVYGETPGIVEEKLIVTLERNSYPNKMKTCSFSPTFGDILIPEKNIKDNKFELFYDDNIYVLDFEKRMCFIKYVTERLEPFRGYPVTGSFDSKYYF